MTRVHRLFLLALLAPPVLWVLAGAVTLALRGLAGCVIHEGFANPCTVAGLDLADTAYAAGLFAAWGPLIAGPVMAAIAALWVLVALATAAQSTPEPGRDSGFPRPVKRLRHSRSYGWTASC